MCLFLSQTLLSTLSMPGNDAQSDGINFLVGGEGQ